MVHQCSCFYLVWLLNIHTLGKSSVQHWHIFSFNSCHLHMNLVGKDQKRRYLLSWYYNCHNYLTNSGSYSKVLFLHVLAYIGVTVNLYKNWSGLLQIHNNWDKVMKRMFTGVSQLKDDQGTLHRCVIVERWSRN